ncbi:hypothetical protein HUT18_02700 [Streptomyces sp. NA04227]|uniref:uridine kinase family protein n=1 Tax=Streptomyces sp. NA04227 TaxID=2742136 RepID=UPI0015926A9B|nr:hypothetical protein [Streptomyces sp. NA04227]QKW05447.1 hypothetical protein HUT18_02700 [Streptomyces sp. NA04227]
MTTTGPLVRLAQELAALPPSCGPVRLVGVDGHAGSGKSTFTERLAVLCEGAAVLHLDDLASHQELFDWTARLREQVLLPLERGRSARYLPYDWDARRFGPARELPAAPVVLIEGVGAGRAALRPWLARLLWLDLGREESWRRGMRRDGAVQASFWQGWTAAEERHFAEDPSRPFADVLVRQTSEGYVLEPGPRGPDRGPDRHGA